MFPNFLLPQSGRINHFTDVHTKEILCDLTLLKTICIEANQGGNAYPVNSMLDHHQNYEEDWDITLIAENGTV